MWVTTSRRSTGLIVFCEDILQCGILQRQVGIHSLQPAVLVFEFLQPIDIRSLQPAVLGLPLIVGRGTDVVAPPGLLDRTAGIGLLQNRHDLRLGEFRLAHGNLLAKGAIAPESSPYDLSQFGGSLRRYAHHQPESLRSGAEVLDRLRRESSAMLAQSVGVTSGGKAYRLKTGAPGWNRTSDPQLRRLMLYPTELRAHPVQISSTYDVCTSCFEVLNFTLCDRLCAILSSVDASGVKPRERLHRRAEVPRTKIRVPERHAEVLTPG